MRRRAGRDRQIASSRRAAAVALKASLRWLAEGRRIEAHVKALLALWHAGTKIYRAQSKMISVPAASLGVAPAVSTAARPSEHRSRPASDCKSKPTALGVTGWAFKEGAESREEEAQRRRRGAQPEALQRGAASADQASQRRKATTKGGDRGKPSSRGGPAGSHSPFKKAAERLLATGSSPRLLAGVPPRTTQRTPRAPSTHAAVAKEPPVAVQTTAADERTAANEAFDIIDSNKDGVIDRQEFNAAFPRQDSTALPRAPSPRIETSEPQSLEGALLKMVESKKAQIATTTCRIEEGGMQQPQLQEMLQQLQVELGDLESRFRQATAHSNMRASLQDKLATLRTGHS